MSEVTTMLRELGACVDALRWASQHKAPAHLMWRRSERGDWLLWVAAKAGVDRRLVVRAACLCAREALVHVPEGETRPLRCIEVTEAWTRGEATIEQVREARREAWAYAAADAAVGAAYADAAYADAAYAAGGAAAAYAYAYAARSRSLAKSAALVRSVIPWSAVRDALAKQERGEAMSALGVE
jgi:hypothetical protein